MSLIYHKFSLKNLKIRRSRRCWWRVTLGQLAYNDPDRILRSDRYKHPQIYYSVNKIVKKYIVAWATQLQTNSVREFLAYRAIIMWIFNNLLLLYGFFEKKMSLSGEFCAILFRCLYEVAMVCVSGLCVGVCCRCVWNHLTSVSRFPLFSSLLLFMHDTSLIIITTTTTLLSSPLHSTLLTSTITTTTTTNLSSLLPHSSV